MRCYQKKQVKAYRIELEFHSGLLRRNGIVTIDDLELLPDLVVPKHLRFVDFDWKKFAQYLRNTDRPPSLLARARRHRNSVHQLMKYLRNVGVTNPHRFLRTHPIDKQVRRALDRWEDEFFRRQL